MYQLDGIALSIQLGVSKPHNGPHPSQAILLLSSHCSVLLYHTHVHIIPSPQYDSVAEQVAVFPLFTHAQYRFRVPLL